MIADQTYLVKLADELIEVIPRYHDDESVLEAAVAALRRLASSDSEVKVRELEWNEFNRADVYAISDSHGQAPRKYILARGSMILGYFNEIDSAKSHAQADYEARIRSALVEVPAVKGEPEPVADWRDDPTSDERWDAGCDFAMTQLCKALDVDPAAVNWDAATETVDGDVQSVIWNILRARMGEDWDPDTAQLADAGMREALEPRLAAAERMADGITAFLDKPEWRPTRAYIEQARNVLRNMVRHVRVSLTAPGATTKSDGGWNEAIEACIQAVRQTGNFGDYKREELTADYGRPKFDMMNAIINALTALRSGALTKSDGGGESRPAHPGTGGRAPCIEQTTPATMPAQAGVAPGPSEPSSTRSDPNEQAYADLIASGGIFPEAYQQGEASMTDDQIKHMVDRFLMWKLPEHFNPDCGISFDQSYRSERGPVGTNLFSATEATAMVRHMLEDLPSTRSDVTVEKYERAIIAWADGEEIELTIRQVHALARALLRRKS